MQQPSDFSRAAAVSFTVLTLSCALFAVFGYMLYGEQTKTLILDNLVCARARLRYPNPSSHHRSCGV
jgi:hypothetical protein